MVSRRKRLLEGTKDTFREPTEAAWSPSYHNDVAKVAGLSVSPLNSRALTKADGDAIKSLMASMAASGLLHPVLVRVVRGGYELLAGRRRLESARRLKWAEIPVRSAGEIDDAKAAALIAVENLQREDLPPLEAAAAIAHLLEQGHTHETAAVAIGQSPAWVAGRASLNQLTDKFKAAVRDPGHAASKWSIAHLAVISRLAPATQDAFLAGLHSVAYWAGWSVADLRRRVEQQYLLALAGAAWKLDDAGLVPDAGSCRDCLKRTGAQQLLWPELATPDKECCTDAACYRRKEAAVVRASAERLKKRTGVEPIRLALNPSHAQATHTNVRPEWEYRKAKRGEPGAIPAVRVDGAVGAEIWVAPTRAADRQASQAGPKTPKTKRLELELRRRVRALQLVREALDSEDFAATGMSHVQLIALAASFGTLSRPVHLVGAAAGPWAYFRGLKAEAEASEALWVEVRGVFQARLRLQKATAEMAERAWAEAEELCRLIGLKSQHYLDEAALQLPEPRAWKKGA